MLSWLDYLPKGKTHIHIHIKCLSLSLNYYFVNLNFKNKRSYKSEDSFSIRREIEGDYFETNGSIWCFKCFNGDLWENILYIYMCVYIYIFFICILFIYMCVCVCVCVYVYTNFFEESGFELRAFHLLGRWLLTLEPYLQPYRDSFNSLTQKQGNN
jgi:hypothetical protein